MLFENLSSFRSGFITGLQMCKLGFSVYADFLTRMYTRIRERTITGKEIGQTIALLVYILWSIYSSSVQLCDIYQHGYIQSVKNGFYRNRYELAIAIPIYLGLLAYIFVFQPMKDKKEIQQRTNRMFETEFNELMNNARIFNKFELGYRKVLRNPVTHQYENYNFLRLLESFAEKVDFNEHLIQSVFISYEKNRKEYVVSPILTEEYPQLLSRAQKHTLYLQTKLAMIKETIELPSDLVDYIIATY